jgi:hypothetical protein
VYRTPLCEVEVNSSEAEMDEEFGILPGEEREECEGGLGIELDVEEGLVVEGRAMEDMCEGTMLGEFGGILGRRGSVRRWGL